MKIRGNTVGTPIKPEKSVVKATDLTEEQKAQARENIGAADNVELTGIRVGYDGYTHANAGEAVRAVEKIAGEAWDDLHGKLLPYEASFSIPGYIKLNGTNTSGSTGRRTGLIPCTAFKYIRYRTHIQDAIEMAFYDSTGAFMPDISIVGVPNHNEKLIDIADKIAQGASYVQLSAYSIAIPPYAYLYDRDILTELETLADETEILKEDVENLKSATGDKPTKDKKILIFGDSITATATMDDDGSNYVQGASTNWPTYIPEMLHTENIKNYACSGATWKDYETSGFRQMMKNQVALATSDSNNDDADIIVISLGTNDNLSNNGNYDTAMSVETLEELDTTILYQAIRYAMWTLRNKYPNAKYFVATPIQRASREPFTLMSTAIKDMARRYNFIVIDAEAESGIIRDNEVTSGEGAFLKDGLHPNDAGKQKMAELYCSVIKQYFI